MQISASHRDYKGTIFDSGKKEDIYLGHRGYEIFRDGEYIPVTLEELNTRIKNCQVLNYNPLELCAVPTPGPFAVPVGTEPL